MRRSVFLALAVLAIAAVALSACASATGAQPPRPSVVEASPSGGRPADTLSANETWPAGQGSGGKATTAIGEPIVAPLAILPKAMQDAPARVRSAYQFAIANPDALKNVPCYCGCGAMGHTSNLSCYIKDRKADGQTPAAAPGSAAVPGGAGHDWRANRGVEFDQHALGCSLCVDITQDVMRMTSEGKSAQEIRATIVSAYSKFGPANQ